MRQAANAPARGFRVGRLGWSLISLLALVALWEVSALIAQSRYLPGPMAVIEVMVREGETVMPGAPLFRVNSAASLA